MEIGGGGSFRDDEYRRFLRIKTKINSPLIGAVSRRIFFEQMGNYGNGKHSTACFLIKWQFYGPIDGVFNVRKVGGKPQTSLNQPSPIQHQGSPKPVPKFSIFQTLLPTTPPLFTPNRLVVNDEGTYLAAAGPDGILVFELPRKCPPYGAFAGNKEVVYCK